MIERNGKSATHQLSNLPITSHSICEDTQNFGSSIQIRGTSGGEVGIIMGFVGFLLCELWFCQNHKRNPCFADVLDTVLKQPIYSHLARVERICPTLGIAPVPSVTPQHVGVIHDVTSFENYFWPTQWLSTNNGCQQQTDFSLFVERCENKKKEIPQANFEVTYMMFAAASYEKKNTQFSRKDGTFTNHDLP